MIASGADHIYLISEICSCACALLQNKDYNMAHHTPAKSRGSLPPAASHTSKRSLFSHSMARTQKDTSKACLSHSVHKIDSAIPTSSPWIASQSQSSGSTSWNSAYRISEWILRLAFVSFYRSSAEGRSSPGIDNAR